MSENPGDEMSRRHLLDQQFEAIEELGRENNRLPNQDDRARVALELYFACEFSIASRFEDADRQIEKAREMIGRLNKPK